MKQTEEKQQCLNSQSARNTGLYFLVVLGCFIFVLLALRFTSTAHAQATCTPTPTPTATPCTLHQNTCPTPCAAPTYPPDADPPVASIPPAFQPPSPDTTILEWRVFAPTPAPVSGKGPAILLLHEGHFAAGWIFSGLLDDPERDLQKAGYYVFVAAYRQAPCGLVTGQACHSASSSGRPPQQTNDVKAFVRAMKADDRCNGKYGIVGGSSGGSHAAFAVFDIASSGSAWPNWNQGGDDRPLAVACLSGAYDFTDRTTDSDYPAIPGDPINDFRNKIENYTGTCAQFGNGGDNQWSSSPVAKLHTFTMAKPFRPMFFINSRHDSMPYNQILDVQCKLTEDGVDPSEYQVLTIPNSSEHAFQYWNSIDGQLGPTKTISTDVINFLDDYLK